MRLGSLWAGFIAKITKQQSTWWSTFFLIKTQPFSHSYLRSVDLRGDSTAPKEKNWHLPQPHVDTKILNSGGPFHPRHPVVTLLNFFLKSIWEKKNHPRSPFFAQNPFCFTKITRQCSFTLDSIKMYINPKFVHFLMKNKEKGGFFFAREFFCHPASSLPHQPVS